MYTIYFSYLLLVNMYSHYTTKVESSDTHVGGVCKSNNMEHISSKSESIKYI